MSDTAEERPVTSPPVEAPRMVAVRRRSRRRRTHITPLDWRRIALLGVMLVAGLLLVADPKLKSSAGILVHTVTGMTGSLRLEVIVLGICGLIWLYLTPGVEDRVLRLFNKTIEKKRRGGNGRGRRR